MLAYYGSHILHTAVAYFDVVLIEKGVILVLLREVFRYELIIIIIQKPRLLFCTDSRSNSLGVAEAGL